MNNIIKYIFRLLTLFLYGGAIYMMIEIIYRGYTHWTMGILGGLCFISIGEINEFIDEDMHVLLQAFIGAIIITALEFITGIIVNIKLGWNIWDYSNMPFNVMGQICLPFFFAWLFLGIVAIILDDFLRYVLFDENMPRYRFKINKRRHK